MVLLITYDLKRPGQQYAALHEEIKKAGTWWHHLESTWIIETILSPQQWHDHLAPYLDKDDNILIIEIKRNYWGWLPRNAWEWLAARNFG